MADVHTTSIHIMEWSATGDDPIPNWDGYTPHATHRKETTLSIILLYDATRNMWLISPSRLSIIDELKYYIVGRTKMKQKGNGPDQHYEVVDSARYAKISLYSTLKFVIERLERNINVSVPDYDGARKRCQDTSRWVRDHLAVLLTETATSAKEKGLIQFDCGELKIREVCPPTPSEHKEPASPVVAPPPPIVITPPPKPSSDISDMSTVGSLDDDTDVDDVDELPEEMSDDIPDEVEVKTELKVEPKESEHLLHEVRVADEDDLDEAKEEEDDIDMAKEKEEEDDVLDEAKLEVKEKDDVLDEVEQEDDVLDAVEQEDNVLDEVKEDDDVLDEVEQEAKEDGGDVSDETDGKDDIMDLIDLVKKMDKMLRSLAVPCTSHVLGDPRIYDESEGGSRL